MRLTRAQVEAMRQELARRSLAGFILQTLPGYQMGWVHKEICRELDEFLQAVAEKKAPRLMITMPPRHGKSEIASRRFPAYALGRYPDLSIIATSYSADLASRMNRDVQRTIDSEEYRVLFPDTRLPSPKEGIRTSDFFEIANRRGVYRSAGVGGGITGMGGDIILIDDPFKDRASADSPTIRENIWDWYTSTLYTRLAPGGGLIIINTRWHTDDLSGRLLADAEAETGDKWRVVNFPAIAEADEEHRKAGEALHPDRYPLEQLRKIQTAIGSRDWEALYQQHPTPEGGTIFKSSWLRYWTPSTLPERFDTVILSWDMTFKDTDGADFVVGQVWGRVKGNFYLLDQHRERMGFVATLAAFKAQAAKWPQAGRKLVEDKANGPAVIDTLKSSMWGILPVEPDGSKIARAHAVTAMWESGNVYLPDPQAFPWVAQFITELTQFPSVAHDDQVDAMTQALRFFKARPGFNI